MRKREGEIRIPSGCAIAAIMDRSGMRHNGQDIIKSIGMMHERSNGLGGGFAAYGIYPDYAELYAFHIFYETREDRMSTEEYLNAEFVVEVSEKIPTAKVRSIVDEPIIWRYFLRPERSKLEEAGLSEDEYTMRCVMHINSAFDGSFVASSGKNMGAFKGVGYPEEIGEFYRIEDYRAWLWTAHGRFPTNTPGWWGGAHPFTLLDWSTVHNGEISSYDANRRYVEMYGYDCTLQTDTEAITYLFDLLVRKHGLSQELAAHIMTAPEWDYINTLPPAEREFETTLRAVYSSALVNGPFSIIIGSSSGMLALNDRLKLRALVAAEKGDLFYLASEEAAIRAICPDAENARTIDGGVPLRVVRYDCMDADDACKGGRR